MSISGQACLSTTDISAYNHLNSFCQVLRSPRAAPVTLQAMQTGAVLQFAPAAPDGCSCILVWRKTFCLFEHPIFIALFQMQSDTRTTTAENQTEATAAPPGLVG